MSTRDYSDPYFEKFRKAVLERDGRQCVLCKEWKCIQVHHIKRWADAPMLRYMVSNGVVLCKKCHKKVTGAELFYQELLTKIARRNANG